VVPDGGSGTGDRAGTGVETAEEGAALLDDLRAAIGRYVVLPSEEVLTAVTLWVAASHIQPALQHAPRLAVVGPTKGCGKSRVLDVLHETVSRPMMTVNTSPAVVFRIIGEDPPTLLVDEADTIFGPKAGDKEDLRGLLNAGHQRNRPAWRISGPEHKPTAFPTFAMAALAGIGDLPDTIMDRAVVLRMQKRKPGEKVAPFRSRHSVPELNTLRDRLAAWLTPLRGTAHRLVPPMPVEDRAADTWEPLVIVADLADGHWPAQARAACLAMTRNEVVQDEQTTLKTRLLRDIRRVFEQQGDREALRSHDLLAALIQDAEAPWAEYGTKGLNAYHLANLLRDFGISPANHRFENGRQAKGDQEKTIRFTRTAVSVISAAAHQRGQKFAGFVGDAALAVALGKAGLVGSPEDDPVRPLIEALEAHTVALNRIGSNLNQITAAIHRGTVPERAEAVLDRVEQAAESSYQLIDQLLTEGTAHGS
jgi:hypothetical protein